MNIMDQLINYLHIVTVMLSDKSPTWGGILFLFFAEFLFICVIGKGTTPKESFDNFLNQE